MVGRAVRMAVEGSSDPLFYNYPPLVFFLFALAERALGLLPGHLGAASSVDPSLEYLVGRLLSAAAFTLAAWLVYRVTEAEHGRPAALLAGVLFALAPLSVRQGHFATTDMISTAFLAAGMYAAPKMAGDRGALLAGVLAGLAIAAKYSAGLVLVYLLVYSLRGRSRARASAILLASALAVVLLLVALTGHPLAYLQGLGFLAGRATSTSSGGPIGFFFYPVQALPFGLGPGAALLVAAGMVVALLKRTRSDLAGLLTIAAGLLLLGPSREVFYRYLLPLFPVLAMLAGGLLRPDAGIKRRALPLVAALLLLPSAYASLMTDWLLSQTDTRQLAAGWLMANRPPGAGLEVDSYWSQPFYDASEAEQRPLHPLYITGDPVADSFQLGRYSDRFRINRSAPDCDTFAASAAPYQGPMPAPDRQALARFSPGSASGAVYDPHDSLYLPIWAFPGVQRPGPAIAILPGC